jgi:hypothetical protein
MNTPQMAITTVGERPASTAFRRNRKPVSLEEVERHISTLLIGGEGQRRHLRGFAREILQKLSRTTRIDGRLLVDLNLPYLPKRRFAALRFFANFLLRSRRWNESDLVTFENLTDRVRGKSVLRFQVPTISGELRGRAFQQIRSLFGIKAALACIALNLLPSELRRIEKDDELFPEKARPGLRVFQELAKLLPSTPPQWLQEWDHFSKPSAAHPLPSSDCPACGSSLSVLGAHRRTRFRGRHWYFKCVGCGGRYWSAADGALHIVNPTGRGWRKNIAERPTCETCAVECVIAGSPGSSSKTYYWACPKCSQHYKVRNGKAAKTRLGREPKALPFLEIRPPCPRCGSIYLRLAGGPPWNRNYLFRCSKCDSGFKWSPLKKMLISLPRRRFTRGKDAGGRPSGMDRQNEQKTREVLTLALERAEAKGATGDALRFACSIAYKGHDPVAALDRARKNVRKFVRLFDKDPVAVKWNETLKRFRSRNKTAA